MDYFKSTTIPLVQRKLPNTLHPWLRCIKPFGDGFGKKNTLSAPSHPCPKLTKHQEQHTQWAPSPVYTWNYNPMSEDTWIFPRFSHFTLLKFGVPFFTPYLTGLNPAHQQQLFTAFLSPQRYWSHPISHQMQGRESERSYKSSFPFEWSSGVLTLRCANSDRVI